MKKNIRFLGAFIVLLTISFSKFMVGKYGEIARVIIMVAALSISILGLVGIIYKKKYLAALGALSMVIPLVVMTIGIYFDNMYLDALGFGLLFVLIPIMIKIISKYNKNL
ncbi:hypothetical protein G9F72_019440 [Clostridium estertheticum]|uniref:hypothetical protein n=1 Tax=Clostridium estertheticum TaxID=238834 RepID=UPI0013E91BC2|nr:hypothetical protein [Clostridium estertheticum]MBZ9688506.1 hypothetical protein [Clostridium estertheticum]